MFKIVIEIVVLLVQLKIFMNLLNIKSRIKKEHEAKVILYESKEKSPFE